MSNREKIPEWIDRFNRGDLTPELSGVLIGMTRNNPRLAEEIKLDKELNVILAQKDIIDLRKKIIEVHALPKKTERSHLQLLLWAAILLLLTGIGIFLLLMRGMKSISTRSIEVNTYHKVQPGVVGVKNGTRIIEGKGSMDTLNAKSGTHSKQKADNLLCYEKNPSLEYLIGTTRHKEFLTMVFPANDSHVRSNEAIRFEWIHGSTGIELSILDNTGVTVIQSGKIDTRTYSIQPNRLKKGLFYFKVLENDEILYFGKFIVE
jgi:hypothetical protein